MWGIWASLTLQLMKPKIAIGIPNTGTIKSKTALCLMELMKLPYEFFPIFAYGNIISENREKIAEIGLQNNCDYIFFIDSDMKFNPIILQTLVNHGKDIIGVDYNYRFLPLTSTVKLFPNTIKGKDLMKVAAVGTGCLLIKTDVFKKLDKPYFPMEYSEGKVICTEDVGFCEKARKEGFDVWCDPSISVGHIGDYIY